MAAVIIPMRPDAPAAASLIAELDAHLAPLYPVESQHGFSVQRLLDEGVDFFVVHCEAMDRAHAAAGDGEEATQRQGLVATPAAAVVTREGSGVAAGCGGIMFVGSQYAEIKRMYIRPAFRGRGLARMLLAHLEDHARARGVPRLRLETGIHQHEAIALYERTGFGRIAPFGPYRQDPVSQCYEKWIG